MPRLRLWFVAVPLLLASLVVGGGGAVAASPSFNFAGSWVIDDVCTSAPCQGEHFGVTMVISQKSGSSSFTGSFGPNKVVGTQSGLGVHFTEEGSGYKATFDVTMAADGRSFKGDYTDNQHGTGKTTATRQLSQANGSLGVAVSASVASGLLAVGKSATVKVTVSAVGGDITSISLGQGLTLSSTAAAVTSSPGGLSGFDLAAGTSQSFDFKVKGISNGTATLVATATGKAASGQAVQGSASLKLRMGGRFGVTWEMPKRASLAVLDVNSNDGLMKPEDVNPTSWRVFLKLTEGGVAMTACPADATYLWTLTTAGSSKKWEVTGPCLVTAKVPQLGVYQVNVVQETPAQARGTKIASGKIVVRDWLVVGLGDSNGSGQANPPYYFHKCARTINSYQYRTALYLEDQDPQSSVTFLFASCSGSTIEHLVDSSYHGSYAGEGPLKILPPQVAQIVERLGHGPSRRKVAAVLLSTGVNDLDFGPVLEACGNAILALATCNDAHVVASANPTMGDEKVTVTSDAKAPTLRQRMSEWVSLLHKKYSLLATDLKSALGLGPLDPHHIIITTYPSFWTDQNGQLCDGSSGPQPRFAKADWQWLAETGMALNNAVEATRIWDWTPATGIADGTQGHGYCSSDSWFQTITGSFARQGDPFGGFHATKNGQDVSVSANERALCLQLYTTSNCTGNPR